MGAVAAGRGGPNTSLCARRRHAATGVPIRRAMGYGVREAAIAILLRAWGFGRRIVRKSPPGVRSRRSRWGPIHGSKPPWAPECKKILKRRAAASE